VLPVTIYCDSIGAIFMLENATATTRTKHVDARYHFVREYVFHKFVKIVFVKPEENKSDMLTKNVPSDLYDKHKNDYIIMREELEKMNWKHWKEGF
jgi:hypothetical protein